jgi:hypothetical protein
MTENGVIQKSTGNLIRAGFCDFENDGSFDASTEAQRTDVPFPGKVRGEKDETQMHRWNGSAWVLVSQ